MERRFDCTVRHRTRACDRMKMQLSQISFRFPMYQLFALRMSALCGFECIAFFLLSLPCCLLLSLTVHLLKICVWFVFFPSHFAYTCCCLLCNPFTLSTRIRFERFITWCTMTSLQIIQWWRWKESSACTRCEKCLLWKLIWCVNTHAFAEEEIDETRKREKAEKNETKIYKNMINKLKRGRRSFSRKSMEKIDDLWRKWCVFSLRPIFE